MKEFKVGDKIKIKSWEEMEKEFGLDSDGDIDIEQSFVKDMKHLCGRTAKIDKINGNNDINLVCWDNTDGDVHWKFETKMFKHVRDTNFKVGDIVRIRSWEDMEEEFGLGSDFLGRDKITCKFSFVVEMIPFCEKVAKITGIDEDDEEVFLSFNSKVDSDFDANFSKDMLEKVEPKEDKQEIYTYRKGNEVISELKVNDEVVKTAKARCCPTDTFDFNFGAKLSLERLFEDDKDEKEVKEVYIKLLCSGGYDFNKKGDILKAYKFYNGAAFVRTEDQIRSVGNAVSKDWIYLNHEYEVLENYDPEEIKEEPIKVGDYIELIESNYSFDKVGMVLKVSKVSDDDLVYVMPESYPQGSDVYDSLMREDGSWGYLKDWYKVLKDYIPPKKNYGKDLIGRKIEAGTRFKVIKISEDRDGYNDLICKDEYIGKTAKFNYDFTVTDDPYGDEMGTFDKAHVEAIDEENGGICWRWDEIEILD